MSHSGDRSTIEAADISERPITITHANPYSWHPALRNKRDNVIEAVTSNGGMIGVSIYPHHLKDKSECTIQSFCRMIANTAEKFGIEKIGIGSDLCQDQPDSVVEWMRVGRWSKEIDYGEGSASLPGFPKQPHWFKDNRDLSNIENGLLAVGMDALEVNKIMGENWYNFYSENFKPMEN
jgi:membrane dipeptidase